VLLQGDSPLDSHVEMRAKRIALHVESLAPYGRVACLDVGFGDAALPEAVQQLVARTRWSYADALRAADGGTFPYDDGAFHVALVCDALETMPEEAAPLLAEAARVARHVIVEVPKLRFTQETFAEIAAQERLAITALDCGLDLHERSPGRRVLQPDWQFIAVLAGRSCKRSMVLSKV
jgi:hypothetical protein